MPKQLNIDNMVRIAILFLFLFVGFSTVETFGQNPNQTKKHKQKLKKMKSKKQDPYEYKPSKKRDSDGDGVPDFYDHCPNTPPGQVVTTFGCPPDTDGDGIFDYEDDCPDVKGPRENKGCPWVDTDGDGIPDKDDLCPDVAGPRAFGGCPDTDGDGIPDHKDECPDVPGLRANKGCPKEREDTDKDGIYDDEDKCPLIPGVASNHGCPELKKEEQEALREAFKNLLFETGKDIIKTSSYNSLNKLAKVMNDNPHTKLDLEGHTDDVGDDDANMTLSKNRANAVKYYLQDQGVNASRIKAQGFGETKPVATNDTNEGRTLNRRVEMILHY